MRFSVPRWMKNIFNNQKHWEEISFFKKVSLFQGLSKRQLGRMMQAMQKRKYVQGERLFAEGQIGKAVFVIQSGQVELERKTSEGKSRPLGILGPGQIFGEMALLEHLPRTATATVVEDGVIFLLYTSTLESLMHHHPDIGVKLLRNMSIMLSALLRRTNKEVDRRLVRS